VPATDQQLYGSSAVLDLKCLLRACRKNGRNFKSTARAADPEDGTAILLLPPGRLNLSGQGGDVSRLD
jgi:hypothetical protein